MTLQWNPKAKCVSVPLVPADAAEGASRTELVILLLLMQDENLMTDWEGRIAELAQRADCTEDDVRAAVQYWRGSGVLRTARTKAASRAKNDETAPQKPQTQRHLPSNDEHTYSGTEVQTLLEENNGSRRKLITECQNILGKIFNATEVNKILHLSDGMGLDNEYILLVFTYCKNHGKKSVHYAEKVALNLYDEGCETPEALAQYLKRKEFAESYEGQIRAAFGLFDRSLTERESKYISAWRTRLSASAELVKAAYDVCVNAKGKVSFAYINSILENWVSQGISTPEQAQKAHEAFLQKQNGQGLSQSSFETDEFLELALRRSQKLANKIK